MGRDETTKTRTRAPGLDGVRALAVLAVMGFHEGASELSGGFLGVDIFFVLSGFLITDLLATQYDLLGRVDLKGFWTRRARRLLPPLAVMLVIVTAAATVIEPAQERSLRLALLAAATYTSNWYQIFHHVSYFEALGPMPPLDHLWSLAIEEQFYLIWPLILWFVVLRLKNRRARVTVTVAGAAISALAMALQYTPGGDPSAVYYGTDTHASALLIGAALALACPLARLESTPAEQSRQLDAMGIAGLAFLAWALGHFSGSDPAVYPFGLILAALAAAGLVAAAASNGVIAAMTGLAPLRWVGIRSYAIYLWHWPVIALGAALVGGPTTPGLWVIEAGVTIALAAASWQFIETPIMQNGFRATLRRWVRVMLDAGRRSDGTRRRAIPRTVAGMAAIAAIIASYGIARPPASVAPAGLLRQVTQGQQVSAASQTEHPPKAAQISACQTRKQPSAVYGWQVTAVGDSVMVAAAAALQDAMPGIYINAQVGRQMADGVAIIQGLAASGKLRRIVVVGLGTNGDVSAAQIRQLRRAVGSDRYLVLVNTYGPMSWESEVNGVLAAATTHQSHVDLANWHQAIADHTGLLWPDGIHPQPSGAKLYAHVVLQAIQAELSSGKALPCQPTFSTARAHG
ncbi:MAG: acyltransferase family protein [Streptosporangiaceae bacterium]